MTFENIYISNDEFCQIDSFIEFLQLFNSGIREFDCFKYFTLHKIRV